MSAKFFVILALAALVCTLVAPSEAAPNKTKKRQLQPQQYESQIDKPLNEDATDVSNVEHNVKESHALKVESTNEKETANKEQSGATTVKETSLEEKERAARRTRRGRNGRRRGGRGGVRRRAGRRGRKGRRVSQVRRRAGKRGAKAGRRKQRRARKQRLAKRQRAGKLRNKNKTTASSARSVN